MDKLMTRELTLDSRDVAEMVEKNHADILRDIRTYIEYLGESKIAFTDFFIPGTYKSIQNKDLPNYQITKKGCEFIAHKLTGQKGALFTATYINKFHKMEQTLKKGQPLQIDSKFIYQIAQQLEEKEKQIALDRPKVIFAEALETSKTSILVGELAKLLARNGIDNMGQNRLFKWLRSNGFLHKKGEQYNLPTQMSIELEIIETKITTINNPDGSVRVTKTPKITGKGQIYFVNKFKKEEIA